MAGTKKLSFKSLGLLTIINIAIAIVGLAQTIAIAAIFGVTRSIEVFFAATTFQMFLRQLACSGQVGDLFTPIFHDLQVTSGKQAARDAFSAMSNVMVLGSMVIAVAAAMFSNQFARILVPGYSKEDIALCSQVFFVTAPLIMLFVANGMFSNFLRAEHYFGVEETLALSSRIVNLCIVVVLGRTLGVWSLVIGMWVAVSIALLGQITFAYRKGYRMRFGLSSPHFAPRTVLTKLPFTFLHSGASQFFAFAFTAAFSYLPPGPFAIYNYANRLSTKFRGVVLQPIGLVFFNHFSRALADGARHVRSYADHALSLSVAQVSVCAVPIACAGDLLLMGIMGGEKFPQEDIRVAHLVLVALTCMMLGSAQYLVSRRTNLALKVVARQFAASGITLVIAGIACYWLIPAFGIWGALGCQLLALVGPCTSTLIVLWFVNREMVAILPLRKLSGWFIASAIAVIVVLALRTYAGPSLDANRALLLLAAGCYGAFSILICCGIAWLLGIEEATEIISKLRFRIRNRNVAARAATTNSNDD